METAYQSTAGRIPDLGGDFLLSPQKLPLCGHLARSVIGLTASLVFGAESGCSTNNQELDIRLNLEDSRRMIEPQSFLRIAYAANILILVPVCWAMFFDRGVEAVFQNAVTDSDGLRLLVGSLWAAILFASVAGLACPFFFAPVLLIQVFYKATWLLTFVVPLLGTENAAVPTGISVCFGLIVLTYPFLFWAGYCRQAAGS
jgi:hypothetical protein